MKQGGLLTKDWLLTLIVSVAFIVAFYGRFPLLEKFDHIVYDNGVKMTYRAPGSTDDIAIIAIDDDSIEQIGRWPWPRSILADMTHWLAKTNPKAIGLQVFLTEPQTDPGLAHIRKLSSYLKSASFPRQANRQVQHLRGLLWRAEKDLNTDDKLSTAIRRTGDVILPMFFTLGAPLGNPDAPLPGYVQKNRLTKIRNQGNNPVSPYPTTTARYPLAAFGTHAKGIGHLNYLPDKDGGVRTEPLLLEHYGDFYPSLPLLLAASSLNLEVDDILVEPGRGVRLGKLYIKTTPDMLMYSGFYPTGDDRPAFATYSFREVKNGKVPASAFRNKIVLLGATATGVGTALLTPIAPDMHAPERTANIVASILNQDFYTRPDWAPLAEALLFLGVLSYLMFMLPAISARTAAFVSFMLLLMLIIIGHYLMISEKVWLRTVSPALLLVAGHLVITTKRFFATERLKRVVETDSAHSNRMLGLSFQAQGQLDMAMDKFRKLPVDKSVLDLIYSLALDYERKRQFGKAMAAYDYILEHDKRFRDVKDRKQRAVQMEGTVIIGNRGLAGGGTMILDAVDHKPTLGRYEVEKELGRGAMGTVYLGRDPKINRVVAIKTLALSDEFESNELEGVKARFFREAETAGRLSHPNIVTIFDAGEEHDLAYIAMEYLQGKDLTNYITADDLLPSDWVLDIIAHVADALDYAHTQEVVHRDIKPANIMYNEEDDTVKVTDFGIARITASSRTRTGVVLGTPSYMSPEQLAGRHVDGRSDLFSLGVTLYEMLTGEQPFTGDSMAALMYQIANKKHPDISRVRQDLPACVKTIIDKVLQKEPEKRYQTGAELKMAIERCLDKL